MIIFRNGRRTIQPKNHRLPDIAKRTIQSLAEVKKHLHDNAIMPNGIECDLYMRKLSGTPCSCNSLGTVNNSFDTSGNLTLGSMNEILSGMEEVSFINPGSSTAFEVRVDYADLDSGDPMFTVENTSMFENAYTKSNIETNGKASIFGSGSSECPICFGIGYVGGFDLYNGFRKTISTSELTDFSFLYYDTSGNNGNRLVAEGDNADPTIFLTVKIPLSALNNLTVRLFDGVLELGRDSYSIMLADNINEEVIDINNIITGYAVDLVIKFYREKVEGFTHLELQTSTNSANPFFVDFPNFDSKIMQNIFTEGANVNLVIPPRIKNLPVLSFIFDHTWGRIWKIISVKENVDSFRNVYGFDCSAGIVQNVDLLHKVFTTRYAINGSRSILNRHSDKLQHERSKFL